MPELSDLEALLRSRVPLLVVETAEERRAVDLFRRLALRVARPAFQWSVAEGLQRLDLELEPQTSLREPEPLLRHIKASDRSAGLYVLTDFHPFLDQPLHVRLLKEIALSHDTLGHTLVLLSHGLEIPAELAALVTRFQLSLPDEAALTDLVRDEAARWSAAHGKRKVATDRPTLDRLVQNLRGLSHSDARRLARNAIVDDGAITEADLPELMKAKYALLDQGGVLAFEFETERFADVGGLRALKRWLELRRPVFLGGADAPALEPPRGMLLVGVQGAGKSLAAKAVAGLFGVPLLRLDFGMLYNKFFGESEKNLRQALSTAALMAPCVLWIDEIEKGIATDSHDGGTSRRILGTLLTWMAERDAPVFLVATANAIDALPPELVRKGRFDEIFFVDLPVTDVREAIFGIHLRRRGLEPEHFDLAALAQASEGFSGAEIEQAVVAALYSAHGGGRPPGTADLLQELQRTRPLSRVMAERIDDLRRWAQGRTVDADRL